MITTSWVPGIYCLPPIRITELSNGASGFRKPEVDDRPIGNFLEPLALLSDSHLLTPISGTIQWHVLTS